jgi:hypothetical protein
VETFALVARRVLFTGCSCWISSIGITHFLAAFMPDLIRKLEECSGGL